MSNALLLRARPRRAWAAHATDRVHLVDVDPHDRPADRALCGATASRGWVMDPAGPIDDCARCHSKASRTA